MLILQCLRFLSKIKCLHKQILQDMRQFSRMSSVGSPDSSHCGRRPRNG